MNRNKLTIGLGWFSVGLGLVEVVAPRRLGRLIGLEHRPGLLRLFGLREIAAGVGILARSREAGPWVQARVVGDALDVALLGSALASGKRPVGTLVALANVLGVTALDVVCALQWGAPKALVGTADEPPAPTLEQRVDEALDESFPASDPPAHHAIDADPIG